MPAAPAPGCRHRPASSDRARSRASASDTGRCVRIVSMSCSPMRVERVERGQRVLEDHADPPAAQLAHLVGRQIVDALALRGSISPPAMRPGGSIRPMTAGAGHRFAGARFAHHAQHLARHDVETRCRRPRPASRAASGTRPGRFRTTSSGAVICSFGFSASRSQSPSRLTDSASTSSVIDGEQEDPPLAREQEVLADADQRAERGLRRRHADAEEGQRRLLDDGEREPDRRDDQHRPHRRSAARGGPG